MNSATRNARYRIWIRDLHLYTGLFISPFVLIFAISTILLNHAWIPWDSESSLETRTAPLNGDLPEGMERLEQAKWIASQLGVVGEIQSIRQDGHIVTVPVAVPGERIEIRADLEAGTAEVERVRTGLWDRLIFLHKTPGPHLAGFRGNWIFIQIWRGLVDGTVALLLFSTASGVYLWLLLRDQRRGGLILLGAGGATFVLLLVGLIA
jgi:hypothetical protein